MADSIWSDLDPLSRDILRGLENCDGEAPSSEVRRVREIKDADRCNYRIREHLEPKGLIETEQPVSEGGRPPAKILTLTEKGKEVLDANDGTQSDKVAERLERLEEQVDGLRQENLELREENEELKAVIEGSDVERVVGRVQELTDDVDALQATTSNLRDALGGLNSDPVVGNETAQKNINTGLILGNALRELAVEEFGEERVMGFISEKQEKFAEEGELI